MNHLAWYANRITSHRYAFKLHCSNLFEQNWFFFKLQVAKNTAYVKFIPTYSELNALTIANVHLFPTATPLRDSDRCWLSRTLCSVLTLPRHLDLLVVMATVRGGLGAGGSGCRGVSVGVGKGGGACRGDHMKGPGFDCTFLEEERVSHDRQALPSE